MKLTCADVLTLITGNLFVSVDRLYALYNGLTNDNLFTHQLPRAFRACEPVAKAKWPEIAETMARLVISPENYFALLQFARRRWGNEFNLEPIKDWALVDPLQEAVSMTGADRVIPVIVEATSGTD